MFDYAHERIKDECPCKDCLVQLMCKDRYNKCKQFHDFLNNNVVVITPEAKVYRTWS